jgi:hypothetical protein
MQTYTNLAQVLQSLNQTLTIGVECHFSVIEVVLLCYIGTPRKRLEITAIAAR